MLGPYEIDAALGAGGMGEVYRARDTRLGRLVAVKVLSPELANDRQFHERFAREARTISQLSHPNICTLHDVGDNFLVMEYLEGETLAKRLERGPIELDETLAIAAQISSALDQAHRAGIVHRDLKPGNVMLVGGSSSGASAPQAKLLDFGLAKQTISPLVSRSGAVVPPIAVATSGALTATGSIVGTFQYMAPEQLEGAEADARADIFAFGAILYEMITGHKAFDGKNSISVITAVMRDTPPSIESLVPVAPRALDRIVHACLAKDPDARLRSTHDIVLQLQWLAEGDHAPAPAAAEPHAAVAKPRAIPTAWIVAAAFALAAVAATLSAVRATRQGPATDAAPIQFTIPPAENSFFYGTGQVPNIAISPDGRQIAFVAMNAGVQSLVVRSLSSVTVHPLPGTEQASYPFWSPDGRSVAFFSGGKLKKVSIAGGSPTALCDAETARGGTWGADNVILFAPATNSPLMRVSATGGAPVAATTLDKGRGETAHRWPQFLPDGKRYLYLALTGAGRPAEVRLASLDSTDATTILSNDAMTTYAAGHVFYWRDGAVIAQPFDVDARQLKGEPIPIAEPVGQNLGYVSFAASANGTIVYSRGNPRPTSQLTWKNRSGQTIGTVGEPGEYFNIALSPDDRRVAVCLMTGSPENRDIWLIDLARSISSRLTFDPAVDVLPTWSPDGARVMFGSFRGGANNVFVKNADGSGSEELIAKFAEGSGYALDWSRDGRFILYYEQTAKTGFDLLLMPLSGDKKPMPFLQTRFNEDHGAFAPDTRWIAYSSNESGREEVYVQPFPTTGAKYQISQGGGTQPVWRADGRELFFLSLDGAMMAAAVDTASGFLAGIPATLFPSGVVFAGNRHQYAATHDGQRFLIIGPQRSSTPTPLTVTVNWQANAAR